MRLAASRLAPDRLVCERSWAVKSRPERFAFSSELVPLRVLGSVAPTREAPLRFAPSNTQSRRTHWSRTISARS